MSEGASDDLPVGRDRGFEADQRVEALRCAPTRATSSRVARTAPRPSSGPSTSARSTPLPMGPRRSCVADRAVIRSRGTRATPPCTRHRRRVSASSTTERRNRAAGGPRADRAANTSITGLASRARALRQRSQTPGPPLITTIAQFIRSTAASPQLRDCSGPSGATFLLGVLTIPRRLARTSGFSGRRRTPAISWRSRWRAGRSARSWRRLPGSARRLRRQCPPTATVCTTAGRTLPGATASPSTTPGRSPGANLDFVPRDVTLA